MTKLRVWNVVSHECAEPNRLPQRIQLGEGYVGEPFDKLVWYVPEVVSFECHDRLMTLDNDTDRHTSNA
jgi:hypothetical protein